MIISCGNSDFSPFSSSPPGVSWETRSIGFASNLNDIAYSGIRYVTVGDSSIFYSSDAYTWNIAYTNAPGELYRIHWTGDKFVAVGKGCILVSTDGISWELTEVEGRVNDVTSVDSVIVAVGDSGRSWRSTDGLHWTVGYDGMTSYAVLGAKGYSKGNFIVSGSWKLQGYSSLRFRYSDDGLIWNDTVRLYSPADSIYVRSMTFFFGGIVSVGDNGSSIGLHHLFSPDDINYTDLHKIVTGHDRVVVVGDSGLIVMSDPDTYNVMRIEDSHTKLNLNGATATELGFVVVGDSGIIISSPVNKH